MQIDTYANVISVSSASRFRASAMLVLLTSETYTLRRPDSGQCLGHIYFEIFWTFVDRVAQSV